MNSEEQNAYGEIASILGKVSAASQYNVLRNLAHNMDREVVRIGAIRAAAAVAGSTARVLAEGKNVKSSTKLKKKSNPVGYPVAFTESVQGKAVLAAQRAARGALGETPTDAEKASLRDASKAVRDCFRGFKEATFTEAKE